MEFIDKIDSKSAKIGVIGLGYVGLPLVLEFCKAGFKVTGFDVDSSKIEVLRAGNSFIKHIDSKRVKEALPNFTPTDDFKLLEEVDCIVICVPTPLNKYREPDLSYVFHTTEVIAKHLRKGQLISLESTTYPGTTDEDMRAILEETGLKAGQDFYLAYSPEREDPNNTDFTTSTVPKVVGGYTQNCLKVAVALYSHIIKTVVPVSSTKVAEATKLLENIYRSVNIAMINEMKTLLDRMGIDVWEVIETAKTKPFGFQAFYPGPGLGGHCIPIDPFYLTWKAREYDISTKFIELAGEVNNNMPYYVVQKTAEALNEDGKALRGASILVLGLAYKKDVDDARESPSFKLVELLQKAGAKVDYNDPFFPHAPDTRKFKLHKDSIPLTEENLKAYDCLLVATDHSEYDPEFIASHAKLVVDTRNLMKSVQNRGNIRKA